MKSKLVHAGISLSIFVGLSAVFIALAWQPHLHAGTAGERSTGDACGPPADADHAEPAGHEDEDEPEHASHAVTRPLGLDELRKTRCEHEVAIIDCDECRYEAGVAKISPGVAQGLVEAWPVRTEQRAAKQLTLTGEVQLDQTRIVEVASAGTGRAEQIHRNLGDRVNAEDMLATIQSAELGEVQAGFLEAQARFDLANRTFEREKQLYERKISSQADYLTARSELASSEAAVAAARKRLQLFGLGDDQIGALGAADAGASFGQLAITSPIAGTVIEQNLVRGQFVDTSHSLYRIADLSHVWVWCDLYESDLGTLHERMAPHAKVPAEVRTGAFPQTAFAGVIDMLGNQIDRETRTLKVRVAVENPEGRLRPGMFVRVFIDLDDERPVLRVPATAVLSDAGRQFVFAQLTDELWIRRDVTVGPAEAGMIEVHEGLRDGEVVAARGAFMFKSEILKEKMGAGCAH